MYPIKPDRETQLRAWLSELNDRADEVRATFVDESVRAEQAYIIPGSEGPLLIYVIEVGDIEQGAKAYASSTHTIDAQHKQIKQECLGDPLSHTPIYDVALT